MDAHMLAMQKTMTAMQGMGGITEDDMVKSQDNDGQAPGHDADDDGADDAARSGGSDGAAGPIV